MKLLIITQAVDSRDPVLGFFHRWIEAFAARYEAVHVICLREGEHHLPQNVTVHSLGKEAGRSRLKYIWNFYRYIWSLRREYDAVFVHMNPEYVVLGGPLWRVWNKPVALWYLHKSVTFKLRIAEKFTNVIFTATPESFRLASSKLCIVGHGIDLKPLPRVANAGEAIRIITTGRFASSKGIREMLAALDVLASRGIAFTFTVAGGPAVPADEAYMREIKEEITQRPYESAVRMLGSVPHDDLPRFLAEADVFLNLSETGSLDKAILEALAAGVPVVTSNDAGRMIVPEAWRVRRDDAEGIAEALVAAAGSDMAEISARVAREHDLTRLVEKIAQGIEGARMRQRRMRAPRALLHALLLLRNTLAPIFHFQEISILCYHSISDADVDTAVTPDNFERHIALLKRSGAQFVSIENISAWHRGEGDLPRRAVAITFDDGYRDFLTAALPILERYQAPAALFVAGDLALARRYLGNDVPTLSADEIDILRAHPLVEIGYHSLTHANLALLGGEEISKEVALRFGARFFAYPGGNYSDAAIEVVKHAGYEAAFSINRGLVEMRDHRQLLPRNVILHDMPDWMIRAYTTRAILWYRNLRAMLK